MDDQAALAWLLSLADQERGVGWNPRASPDSQWKLGRTRALLDLAGAPDRRLRIALVAGTKGKGSTCAMLASISAAGVRCGLYTKPHLQRYRERIRVDGRPSRRGVRRRRGADAAAGARLPPEAGEPTTFEVTTALALDEFARAGCEMAVVEVGLGGRLDATNATDPCVSVITSISYDHTAILGRTLGAIAGEKAGILRPVGGALAAAPAACGRAACALEVRRSCAEVAPLATSVTLRWRCRRAGALALACTPRRKRGAGVLGAPARRAWRSTTRRSSVGLRRVRWPGRFEVVGRRPRWSWTARTTARRPRRWRRRCRVCRGPADRAGHRHQSRQGRAGRAAAAAALAHTVWATRSERQSARPGRRKSRQTLPCPRRRGPSRARSGGRPGGGRRDAASTAPRLRPGGSRAGPGCCLCHRLP